MDQDIGSRALERAGDELDLPDGELVEASPAPPVNAVVVAAKKARPELTLVLRGAGAHATDLAEIVVPRALFDRVRLDQELELGELVEILPSRVAPARSDARAAAAGERRRRGAAALSDVCIAACGCDRPAQEGGLCWGHAKRRRLGKPQSTLREVSRSNYELLVDAAIRYADVDAEPDQDGDLERAASSLRGAARKFGLRFAEELVQEALAGKSLEELQSGRRGLLPSYSAILALKLERDRLAATVAALEARAAPASNDCGRDREMVVAAGH